MSEVEYVMLFYDMQKLIQKYIKNYDKINNYDTLSIGT